MFKLFPKVQSSLLLDSASQRYRCTNGLMKYLPPILREQKLGKRTENFLQGIKTEPCQRIADRR